jgi:hypothetical protein
MSSESVSQRLLLHVVTPCARIENLPALAESVRKAADPRVELRWWIVLDGRFPFVVDDVRRIEALRDLHPVVEVCPGSGVAGHAQRNHALERIDEGWIVYLDDDNLLHPLMPRRLAETVAHSTARAVVFDQDLGGSLRRAAASNVRVGKVDSAQFAVERAFVGTHRFREYVYAADSIFLESLFRRDSQRFLFLSEVLSSYNALTPGTFAQRPAGRQTSGPIPIRHSAASIFFHQTCVISDQREEGAQPVKLRCDVDNERLYLSAMTDPVRATSAGLRARILPGRQRMTLAAWADHSIAALRVSLRPAGAPELEITTIELTPAWPLVAKLMPRWLSPNSAVARQLRRTRRINVVFEAPSDSEIEIAVTIPPSPLPRLVIATLESIFISLLS